MRTKLVVGGLGVAVALLAATNPVVVEAAGQITGKQIKNETIKSKDVKDASLLGKDLKDGSLEGTDVKDGSLGLADLAPTVLSRLGSTVYVFRLPKEPTTNLEQSYLLQGVPAGTYVFDYSVSAVMGGATERIFCAVHAVPGNVLNLGFQYGSSGTGISTASAGGVLVKPAGPSELVCGADIGGTMALQGEPGTNNGSMVTLLPVDSATTVDVAP